jgi:SOS-response transcriptional repressor LexA
VQKPEKTEIFSTVGRRLKQARIMLGFDTQQDLAKALGNFAFSQVSRAERDENLPTAEMLLALAQQYINVNWLLTGRGEMFIRDAEHPGPAYDPRYYMPPAGLTLRDLGSPPEAKKISVVSVWQKGYEEVPLESAPRDWPGKMVPCLGSVAAGRGIETTEADSYPPGVADSYIIYRGAPPKAFALKIAGDSMEPKYRQGDVVIVDPDQPERSGIVCCVFDPGTGSRVGAVKRLSIRGRTAVLESMNPKYKPLERPAAQVSAFKIVAHLHLVVPSQTR